MGLIGFLVGGCIIVYVLSAIIGAFFFKENIPSNRAIKTTLLAYLLCSMIAGFGFADDGPYYWQAFLVYL